jgi:HEAT repeat protein
MVAVLMLLALLFTTSGALADARCEAPVVAELAGALEDRDEDVRAIAAEMLGEVAPADGCATSCLLGTLSDESESVRVRAVAAKSLRTAAVADDGAFELLVRVALDSDADWRVRSQCVESLWSMDSGRSLACVLELSGGRNVIETPRAVVSLAPGEGGLGEDNEAALEDPDPRVRRLAVIAVGLAALESDRPVLLRPGWVRATWTRSGGVEEAQVLAVETTGVRSRPVHLE